ncbi:hypothetical protein NMG60_11016583 [Bertholletia excelsa]
MGRAPCCDKANVKKGPWSPEEDAKLKSYIEQHGTGGNWIALPQKIGLKRCGKSCRLRWLNYLRPNIKHGGFSEEEDYIICSLYATIGSRWSIIAAQLPGRTDNDIKNYWNTRLKKKLMGKQRKEHQARKAGYQKIKKLESESSSMASDTSNNQVPYRPELPILAPTTPYTNQVPSFNDNVSIRKLLIKLGGKFSNDENPFQAGPNLQYAFDLSCTHQPYEVPSIELLSQSSVNPLNTVTSQLVSTQYISPIVPGQITNFPGQLEEVLYDNPAKLDGLEFLSGDMVMGKSEATSGEGNGWDAVNSLVYPPFLSNYEAFQRGPTQGCGAFDEL